MKNEEYLQGLASNPLEPIEFFGHVDLNDERWHYVAATYNGEISCLYIDGDLMYSLPISGNIIMDDSLIIIGDNPDWGGGPEDYNWNGLIDDVRIYSYALDANEVKMLYEGKEPPREK